MAISNKAFNAHRSNSDDTANTRIYDAKVDRQAQLRLVEEHEKAKVSKIITQHKNASAKLIQEHKGSRATLTAKLVAQRDKTFKELMTVSSGGLRELVVSQAAWTANSIEEAVGSIWRTARPGRRIAEEIVLKRPLIKDKTLAAGWAGIAAGERLRVEQLIRRGIAERLTMPQIATQVRKSVAFKVTDNQARTLVTTAMTSVEAQADHAVYEANEGLLQGYQYISVLDSRTTDVCIFRDGKIFPIGDYANLPPAHYGCRSSTTPIAKSYDVLAQAEGLAQIRKRNFKGLSAVQRTYYDGLSPLKESYDTWLRRQSSEVQLRHLGDRTRLRLFREGKLSVDKFITPTGVKKSIRALREITNAGTGVVGDTTRFAMAKEKLDALKLGVSYPDDLIDSPELKAVLKEYYKLQAGELDGLLSLVNYRGITIGAKRAGKARVLSTPPSEDNLVFNPLTGSYDDARMYSPSPATFQSAMRRIDESPDLLQKDKDFIKEVVNSMDDFTGVNHKAVVAENLRILFTRSRKTGEPWGNFKAVTVNQLRFDVMNISDEIETSLRKDADLLKKMKSDNFIDPVLGAAQLDELHDNLYKNIRAKNKMEDSYIPKLGKRLQGLVDTKLPLRIAARLDRKQKAELYLKFARRLALSDGPERDQLAVTLGRDFYNAANLRGSRREWYNLGNKLLEDAQGKGIFDLISYGAQKRRMRSRVGGKFFGQYYDTNAVMIHITDPGLKTFAQLQRKIDVGIEIGRHDDPLFVVRSGYKTYFVKQAPGIYYDTRIPVVSSHSFSNFPSSFLDGDMVDAMNWAAQARYGVDHDMFTFTQRLLNFKDDRGKAAFYDNLNEYRSYMSSRNDAYSSLKTMEWHNKRELDTGVESFFTNPTFLDNRGRLYTSGYVSPMRGETFRPFLKTRAELFSPEGFKVLDDQIGAFLGGLSDTFEASYDSLTVLGRQRIAAKWREDLIAIGNHARRGRPNDIRSILENRLVAEIDGEEQGKFFRFAIEASKIDEHLRAKHRAMWEELPKPKRIYREPNTRELYSEKNLSLLNDYRIGLPLEQDASSSGAQIIALTTKNRQLAEISNVVSTNRKKRLYDEIAALTFDDPRFRELNLKLGLTERDLRKAAKAQNMVTFYGAGQRTGIMNVERKLAKILDKGDTLVVTAADRDSVLAEISARAAKYKQISERSKDADIREDAAETYRELMALRTDVKDVFDKGLDIGDELMEALHFLDPSTREFVEKMTKHYSRVVTPGDFKLIAQIMSENLAEQAPVVQDFTRFFGRLSNAFLSLAKPSEYSRDVTEWLEQQALGIQRKRPPKLLEKFAFWKPDGTLEKLLYGAREFKLPKSDWTIVPWVNFDGKVLQTSFTQRFEEKLQYKDADGNWITNIVQVDQKTDPSWFDELMNKEGTINDIVDLQKARTAYAVNGNHANDATLVKQFHLWGKRNGIETGTIHDAFFSNIMHMNAGKTALREAYANAVDANIVDAVLEEMVKRGLPRSVAKEFREEAIVLGLLPIAGKSKIGGRYMTPEDILTKKDVLSAIESGLSAYETNKSWYGIGP